MAKGGKDLVEQARNTGARMRAKAAPLMDKGFLTEPAAASQRIRTQPGDAQQVNDAQKNMQNGSPSAQPTRFASGGKVGGKCMACGGAAHKGMCAGGKMAKGGKAGHDDTAEDTKLFNKLYDKREKSEPKELAKGGKLGSGSRFAKLKGELSNEKGVTDPGALAASIGRKKYGAPKMAKMAAANRKYADGGRIDPNMEAYESGPRTKVVPGAAGAGPKKLAAGGMAPRNKVQKFAVGGIAKQRRGVADKSGHAIAQPTKTSPAWK